MHKIGDDTSAGDQAASLENAHRMIKELAGHCERLQKRLDGHAQRLTAHDNMHGDHARRVGEHDARLRKLENANGMESPSPSYKLTQDQLVQMGREFREGVRKL